jgi:hypothetical protein
MKTLYINPTTGELYHLLDDEKPRNGELPLTRPPKSSCNRCHGTMIEGTNSVTKEKILCGKCRKYLDTVKINAIYSEQLIQFNNNTPV